MEDKKVSFVRVAKELEDLQEVVKNKLVELNALMSELGVGTYIQDPLLKTVYKVVVPKGRFVNYVEIDYVRTALEGERSGSLSKKDAEAMGFKLQ